MVDLETMCANHCGQKAVDFEITTGSRNPINCLVTRQSEEGLCGMKEQKNHECFPILYKGYDFIF